MPHPNNTNLGLILGQSLGGLSAALAGGGQGQGRTAAYQDYMLKARADESLADAALKQRQTAPSAEEMAANEVGITGEMRDALINGYRGGKPTINIPEELQKSFMSRINAFSSVAPSNFEQIQKGLGQSQENRLISQVAKDGYDPNIAKALLLSNGKAPFAGGTYNSTDLTTGKQGINNIGNSLIALNKGKGDQAIAAANLAYSGIDENNANIGKMRHDMGMDELEFARKNSEFDREQQFKDRQESAKGSPSVFSYDKLPANHKLVYAKNASALKQIDRAIEAIQKRPESLGFINVLGDNISQRRDPEGVSARSAVAGIGGVKLHDLSGAAISPSESKRLMPLIPTATDTPEAAIDKLNQLKAEYADINSQIETMYTGGNTPQQGGATSSWGDDNDILSKYGGTPELLAKFKAMKGRQ